MEEIAIKVIRSNRKSIGLEIQPNLQVILRIPYRMNDWEVKKFLKEKESWIEKHYLAVRERVEQKKAELPIQKMTQREIQALCEQAMAIIPQKVEYYAPIVGVNYGRITIRNQRTRWGSCSSKGNLNFNCLLMKAPEEVVDYVVVHELCHRLEMNHSKRFWAEVERVLPTYKNAKKWLKDNGSRLMEQMW